MAGCAEQASVEIEPLGVEARAGAANQALHRRAVGGPGEEFGRDRVEEEQPRHAGEQHRGEAGKRGGARR